LQRAKTITDGVHEAVLGAIVAGEIRGGDELRDKDWAARFGVSRTPVREAFKRLEAHGLTDVAAARFTKVRMFTPEEARQEAIDWAMLHGTVVRSLIRDADEDLLDRLQRAQESARGLSPQLRRIASFEFVQLVREVTPRFGLRLAATAAAYRYELVTTSLLLSTSDDAAFHTGMVEFHSGIIDALSAADPAIADAAFERWKKMQMTALARA
jgi:DNA-binding GntR family transcriptional regulator